MGDLRDVREIKNAKERVGEVRDFGDLGGREVEVKGEIYSANEKLSFSVKRKVSR